MTNLFIAAELHELLTARPGPCVSIYQPVYRSPPEQTQNRIRFENLVRTSESMLRDKYDKRTADELVARLHELLEDREFLRPTSSGLAVFAAPHFRRIHKLPQPAAERVHVGDLFYFRPLIRIFQTAGRFLVLGISAKEARLLSCHRDAVWELDDDDGVPRTIFAALSEEYTDPSMPKHVDPHSRHGFGGPVIHVAPRSRTDALTTDVERFFRVVSRAVAERYSHRLQLPLVLAALSQHQAAFFAVSANPFLLDQAVAADPFSFTPEQLRDKAWEIVRPLFAAKLERLRDEFFEAKRQNRATDDFEQLREAASRFQVRTLVLEQSEQPSPVRETGADDGRARHEGSDGRGQASSRDVCIDMPDDLDVVAECVLRHGGEVLVLSREQMPTSAGAAGILRFP